MDHLPWPQNDEAPPLEIPYICDALEDFDGLNFLDYPIRRGWSTLDDEFQWMTTSGLNVAERAQGWLFFGLLQVFLGDLFEKSDYIAPSRHSQSRILNTNILPLRLSNLARCVEEGGLRRSDVLVTRGHLREMWNSAFLEARLHYEVLKSHMNDESLSSDETLRIVAAPIPILLQSLQRIVLQIFWHDEEHPAMCVLTHEPSELSFRRIQDIHQCLAQARHLYQRFSPFLNHYLSGLPRKYLKGDHSECSFHRCVGNTVDEASYRTRHVQGSCSCQSTGPDASLLCQLIQGNRIPLVELRIVAGVPKLRLIPAEPDTKYVTLSHVWAGGLGNFQRNELPACQLRRLHDLLVDLDKFRPIEPSWAHYRFQRSDWFQAILDMLSRADDVYTAIVRHIKSWAAWIFQGAGQPDRSKVSAPVHFWMDTLCIPVDPQHRDLRVKAIGAMALVYAAAERCLVLDPELQHISMKGLDAVQVNAHVLCSTWLTRSWTYQEARLSRAWYIQFADGLYNPNSAANEALHYRMYVERHVYRSDAHDLASEMISWYHDMPAVRRTDILENQVSPLLSDSTDAFITTWNHLASRSTSKMEDVHGILANVLDRSAEEVLRLPVEERMKAILHSYDRLPAGLIFNPSPKVKDSESRWVPLYPGSTRVSNIFGVLHPSQEGFLLDKSKGRFVGFLVDRSVPRYEKMQLIDPSGSGPLSITFLQERGGPPCDHKASGDVLALCYLVGGEARSSQDRGTARTKWGARFALRKREGNILHLVYEYSFLYSREYPVISGRGKENSNTVYAERTDAETEFHVDCGVSSWPTLTHHRDTTSEQSAHGLTFYHSAWPACIIPIWASFSGLSMVSSLPPRFLLPTIVYFVRLAVGFLELKKLQKRVNEHAYKAWVKTFDTSGSLRKRDTGRQNQQGFDISMRVKVSMGMGMGVWFLAVVVHGLEHLRWFGPALLVEVVVRWAVEWMWWNTRVKRWVKGYVKGRNWW